MTRDVICCLRGCLQPVEEMPEDHVSKALLEKREVEDVWEQSQSTSNSKYNSNGMGLSSALTQFLTKKYSSLQTVGSTAPQQQLRIKSQPPPLK